MSENSIFNSKHPTRRDFLKTSFGTMVGTSLLANTVISTAKASTNEAARLESPDLILKVFDSGTFEVAMKAVNYRWLPDPWQGVACRVTLKTSAGQIKKVDLGSPGSVDISKTETGITSTFHGPDGLTVETLLEIKGKSFHSTIKDVKLPRDTWLISVEYPYRSFYLRSGEENGYLVLTNNEGCVIPTGKVKLGTINFWAWHDYSHSRNASIVDSRPSMPFYGAQNNGSGYTAIIESPDDFSFQYIINYNLQHTFDAEGVQSPYLRISCAWPIWLSQKGQLGYERKMRYEFDTGLDYVKMAKAYRRDAIARKHHVTLLKKSEARPQVAKLAGAPYLAYYAGYPHTAPGYFDYTYKQLNDVIDDLAGPMGLKRAFVHFWGAYSVQPPGCLPFDTAPGTEDELKNVVQKCKDHNYLFTLYNDISAQLEETALWMPELMWKTSDGKVRQGRRWSRTCSCEYVDLLSKNMPRVIDKLGVEACYVDCINAGQSNECYDPKHPLTREKDREARAAFYKYVHSLGLIFGGEHVGWWNAAELEYTNGVGIMGTRGLLANFHVPLYHLVFHDAIVPFCHAGDDYSVTEGTAFEDKVLRDLLRGIPPMFFINLWDHKKWRKKIIDSYKITTDTAAQVMYDEMTSHELVTDDQMVQRSGFASGVEVVVNFDEITRNGMPGKGFRVTGLKDGPRKGQFTSEWRLT